MSTQAIEAIDPSFLTTDDMQFGFAAIRPAVPADGSALSGRQADDYVATAWANLLQGELEEAVDAALLRATFAHTPTLSGRNHRLFT